MEGTNYLPIWTPDGKRVTFCSDRAGQRNLLWKPVDGSGDAELLYSSQYTSIPFSWSSNGKLLAFFEVHPTTGYDIWVLPLEADHEPELIFGTKFNEWGPAFSPDDRWIAYISDKDGRFQVYVRPYPGPGAVTPISTEGGLMALWSRNGDELFYRNGDKIMAVPVTTEPEFHAGIPTVVVEGPYLLVPGRAYDVSPDGQRFLVLQPEYDDSEVRELHIVLN